MNYIHDTHYHLDLTKDPEAMADTIEAAGIYTIAVTNSPSVFRFTQKIASKRKFLRAALGLHPELAYERNKEVDSFIDLSTQTRYIGEVGLDNSNKSKVDYTIQKKVFSKIIETCANQKNKIITVHSRKSSKDVIDIISSNFPGKIILHWYSGGLADFEKSIENGYYFSINYPMTLSDSGRRLIQRIPLDRILLESDGPFTTLNSEACTPLISKIILERIVSIKSQQGVVAEEVQSAIGNNFKIVITDDFQ
jgi:TatD DNase family protein